MEPHVTGVTHVIQLALAPVFLLTAVATLISTLNARLARIADRLRTLQLTAAAPLPGELAQVRDREFSLLARRSHLSYLAILAAVIAGLFICLVVALAFIGALLQVDLGKFLAGLFILAMVSMIASLSFFLRETYLAAGGRRHYATLPAPSASPGS